MFSAVPTICPRAFTVYAPRLRRRASVAVSSTPFWAANAAHVAPVPASPRACVPQKSSPPGSLAAISACPTAMPLSLIPNAMLLRPALPRSVMTPLPDQTMACAKPDVRSRRAPAIKRLFVIVIGCPGEAPTMPRSLIE